MLYLNEEDIKHIGVNWLDVVDIIKETCFLMKANDFSQPVKPYLRYRDKKNRIIAMPAFVGGSIDLAGIKWIASFPDNINHGIKRAHSVTVLNNSNTGVPVGIINTPMISGIRTAGVSGAMIDLWDAYSKKDRLVVGICGLGPIGQFHLDMVMRCIGYKIDKIMVYDIRPEATACLNPELASVIEVCTSWQDAYRHADIFISCTVSSQRYINEPPKKGSLQLNVSLRDYYASWKKYADIIIVDDWEEICRENTDIEMMHLQEGLNEDGVYCLANVVADKMFEQFEKEKTVMFNPMGMSAFDIAIGGYFLKVASAKKVGTILH